MSNREYTQETARKTVYTAYSGRSNMITPVWVDAGWAGRYAWELSKGSPGVRPFSNMWGVTVVSGHGQDRDSLKCEHELSKPFFSEAEAREYISQLSQTGESE